MVTNKFLSLLLFLLISSAYSQDPVDFTRGAIKIDIDPVAQSVEGSVTYTFDALIRTDSVIVNVRDLDIIKTSVNRKNVPFRIDGKQLIVYRKIKEGKSYDLRIDYQGEPRKAIYFIGWNDSIPENNQVWTQGQGKYSSHWVPSFDDMSEKVIE